MKVAFVIVCSGSPPHARGKLTKQLYEGLEADHPRMRGENRLKRPRPRWKEGSPPHARGKPWRSEKQVRPAGITPACAGKTHLRDIRAVPNRDHPRMRGENS